MIALSPGVKRPLTSNECRDGNAPSMTPAYLQWVKSPKDRQDRQRPERHCSGAVFAVDRFDPWPRATRYENARIFETFSENVDGRYRRILLKNPLFWRQHLGFWALSARQISVSAPHVANIGAGSGMSFASFRRFWAVAAKRNSSLAPLGPRRRNRSSLRMRLR